MTQARSAARTLVPDPQQAEFVFLGIPDVNGSIRGKALRPSAFEAALQNGAPTTDLLLALDPTDAPIASYTEFGIRSGAADLIVRPDPKTLRSLAWMEGWQICLGTPEWPDGRPCELCSRQVLRSSLEVMMEQGYAVRAAFEYEIRLRDADRQWLSTGISYSLAELARFEGFITALLPALDALGVELSAIHTEAGPGLLEINVAPRPGLEAADAAALLKLAIKEVASSLGLRASFLAKVAPDEEGSSGHIHFSCWREDSNAFDDDPTSATASALSAAIAGVLEHLAGASLLLNPTINSYKRLVPGYFAPVNATWGLDNRSCAVRVVRSSVPSRARIECRRPGADANPYLALAAVVASAADGIRRKAEPPPPVEGDASSTPGLPELPGSLESALAAFAGDEPLRELLGRRFSEYYVVSRLWELEAWRNTVTQWELDRYERAV